MDRRLKTIMASSPASGTLPGVSARVGPLIAHHLHLVAAGVPGVLLLRDMLQDIGTEEFTHLEVIAMLIEHQERAADAQDRAYNSTLFSLRGFHCAVLSTGLRPRRTSRSGSLWSFSNRR